MGTQVIHYSQLNSFIEDMNAQVVKWQEEQDHLKQKLIEVDDFPWIWNEQMIGTYTTKLRYVAGFDISFTKGLSDNACACVVILSYPDLNIVYKEYKIITLKEPYISGYLALREVEYLVSLFNNLKKNFPQFLPDLVFVDGNGILHPRGFGLACHLGVLIDLPTIGIAKKFLHIDSLTKKSIKEDFSRLLIEREKNSDSINLPLIGKSGKVWGSAFSLNSNIMNPIYVSVGHRISLSTAIDLTERCSKCRVPEPIRQADIISRQMIRKISTTKKN